MKKLYTSPVIVIDCPRNRIRIHRNALHLLGDPDYIVLMVNPSNLSFAIIPSRKLQIAHAVRWKNIADRQCFELCSKSLIMQLCNVCPNLEEAKRLRLTGEYIQCENVIQFRLDEKTERRSECGTS